MSTLAEYLAFAERHPALFKNPPGAAFEILTKEADIQKAESEMAEKLKKGNKPTEWAQVGIAYQDQYIMILRDAVKFLNGEYGTYIRMVGDDTPGVITLPIYQGQVLLIRHFRHATRSWHIEIPRGFGTKGVPSEEMAQTELEQEIKAVLSRPLVSLGRIYPDTGASSGYDDFFFAEIESYGPSETNEGIVEILPTPLSEFERMIGDNELTDGYTITAFALAKAKGLFNDF